MKTPAAVLAVLAAAGPASAGDLPRFDVERHCKQVASFGGSYSATIDQSCFDMEQDAYDKLKSAWAGVPDQTAAHCTQVAGFGGPGSYSILESCIGMELDAAGSVGNRQFKF